MICIGVDNFQLFYLDLIMSSAQDPFYIVKEEIQDSVSLVCFCFQFMFPYIFTVSIRDQNLILKWFEQSVSPIGAF